MGGSSAVKRCGLTEQIIFVIAIASGTACSICSKVMMQMHGEGIGGDTEIFGKPIFQTFGMFVGMLFGMVMHYVVILFKIPFPGYVHGDNNDKTSIAANGATYGAISSAEEGDALLKNKDAEKATKQLSKDVPGWMYFFLAIPSLFDLIATALCMMGLVYLDVSVYILLRGSGIIFIALMKQYALGDRLYTFQWVGVCWNVFSVILVGMTAVLNSQDESRSVTPAQSILGVVLVMAGAFVQALQFVFEEKVMHMEDTPAPPLLLVGMEGVWGTVLCLLVVYPIAYMLPGDDHGSYEDPFNTWYMFLHNTPIQWSFVVYFVTIFSYNLFAILVTYMLNSVWHGILDNFRPVTVWVTDLLIFYVFVKGNGDFGEPWTQYSWIQVGGMFILLYGTAVYNAPNPGCVKMDGSWYAFGINLQKEYDALEEEMKQAEADDEWAQRAKEFKERRESSFII
ncbi:35 member F6 [Seminavis robusta]|uniref:35 member F6 n=1 Tax=Seminavis robusta TaxID=568900 RepID=A0A9N8HP39_9STRA|nr:35 member F6 [Seminavis robusta]|eukprot:Sro1142_g245820.1 35 member F6 (453) ;mRNA; f:21713-23167